MLKFIKNLEDNGVLSILDGLVTIGWYGYACQLIRSADIGLIPKVLLILVGLWFALDHIIHHHLDVE